MRNVMVKVYYKLIKADIRTIDQVPEDLKEDVLELLDD